MDQVADVPRRGAERIRTDRSYVQALVASDTFALLADRVERMLSHGRRISIATRGFHLGGDMEVKAGLTVDRIERRAGTGFCAFHVHLGPDLATGFGFSVPTGDDALTEQQAWARFYTAETRYNQTRLIMKGGLADDGPARDDQITLDRWNSEGYRRQTVVVFDYGPDPDEDGHVVTELRKLLPLLGDHAELVRPVLEGKPAAL